MIDHSQFLLDMRQYLRDFEEAMNNRSYKEAQLYAESALVEARMLCLIAKEKVQ
jgi:hypothetical protein